MASSSLDERGPRHSTIMSESTPAISLETERAWLNSVLGDASRAPGRETVTERLVVLRQLDWLETVSRLTGSTQHADPSSLQLYHALKTWAPLDLAYAAASSLNLSVLAVLFRLYPYSILPYALDILNNLPMSCPVSELLQLLALVARPPSESIISFRVRDLVESEGVLRESFGSQILCDIAERSRLPLTEHALRSCSGNLAAGVSKHDVEKFMQQRAFDMDSAGLILDAVQLLNSGSVVQVGLDAYVAYVVLRQWVCGVVPEGLQIPEQLSMREYMVKEGRERLAVFLGVCMLVDCNPMVVQRDDGHTTTMWVLRHEHMMDFVRECGKDEKLFHDILIDAAYRQSEWMMAFVRSEAEDPDGPVVMGSLEILGRFCCDVLRHAPPIEAKDDIETILTFQVLLSEVAQELAEKQPSLTAEVFDVNRAFKVSALMDQLGTSIELVEAFRMMAHCRECVGLLHGVIEERYAQQMPGRGWISLHAALSQLVLELDLSDLDAQSLFEAGSKCCLRLGHVGAAEHFLERLDVSKREDVVIACAYDVLETSESVETAKKILNLASESERARVDAEFVETVSRLRSQGIDISFKKIKKSSDASQLFRNAICNASTTKGLRDVDGIVGLSESLGTGLQRNEVLLLLGETSFALQDADLCSRTCVEMIDAGTVEALPLVTKIVESPEFLERLEGKGKLVRFALIGAKGDRLLNILANIRQNNGRGKCRDDETVGQRAARVGVETRDPRTAMVMVASVFSGQDATTIRTILDSREDSFTGGADINEERSFYAGALCGVAIRVISSCIDNVDPCKMIHMPVSVLCQWACACLDTTESATNLDSKSFMGEYVDIMRGLSARLVAAADEQRVSVINDKGAEDLWATGDVNAQRHVLMQMTDKIAACRVSQSGTISSDDYDDKPSFSSNEDLADVIMLARRCGTIYDDIEASLFRGVLNRHGATKAFGSVWAGFSEKHPREARRAVLEFSENVDEFINNYEVIRVLRMLEQTAMLLADDTSQPGPPPMGCRETLELCQTFVRETNNAVPLGRMLHDIFHLMRTGGDGGGDGGNNYHQWCLNIANQENARALYEFFKRLTVLWPSARLIDPTSIILGVWSKTEWDLSMLRGLDPDLVLELGLAYIAPSDGVHQDISVLGGILSMTRDNLELPGRKEIVQKYVELSMQECQDTVGAGGLSNASLDDWVTHIVGMIDGTEDVSGVVNRIASSITSGLSYDSAAHIATVVAGLSCVNVDTNISGSDMVERAYRYAIERSTDVLRGDQTAALGSVELSVGEAVQNIFAIVQSLDCQTLPRADGDVNLANIDRDINSLRSLVYQALKQYVSANATKAALDVLQSEVQIQLVEMMMTLGEQRWQGWDSGEQRDDLRIPVYSRLVSHFSTTWDDALEGLDPAGFASIDESSQSLVHMSRRATNLQQASAVWDAVTAVLLPHFRGKREGMLITPAVRESFRDSALEVAIVVISHGTFSAILKTVDEFSTLFGGIPKENWGAIDSKVGGGAAATLLNVLFGNTDGDGSAFEDISGLLKCDNLCLLAAITIVSARKACVIAAHHIKTMCIVLRDDIQLAQKISLKTTEGMEFKCPIRVLVFAHLVAQLIIGTDGKSQFARAAYVAFEFVCLETSLRIQDSAESVIEGILAGVATVTCDGAPIDAEVWDASVLGKSKLAQILREAPNLCREALTTIKA